MGMNQRGNVVIFILLGLVALALIAPVTMIFFKPADILMRLILIFVIFSLVRGWLGSGILSIIVSAVLIYFLVIKYAYLSASVFLLYILMGFAFLSVIVWGIGTRMPGKGG